MKKSYIVMAIIASMSGLAIADMAPPPQAVPPVEPQERPEPQVQSTGIVVEYAEVEVAADGAKDSKKISGKTRNEIYAMLADEVKTVDNVVIIEHGALAADVEPVVESSQLSVADQPNGHFRVFAEILPDLDDGKAILKMQLLKAGHSADANDMVKPLSEDTFEIDPANVRASQEDIHGFLAEKLHMSSDGQAQETMDRPNMSMWIEVKNNDGSEGVKDGSKLVVYYKPDSNVYMNLYYVNSKNEIQRLIPSKFQQDNFAKEGQIYRFPAQGEGLTIQGEGTDKIRAIYTRLPSGVGVDMGLSGTNARAKQAPIGVIPTQYPAIFTTEDLGKFFSLPEQIWNEYEISYTIE